LDSVNESGYFILILSRKNYSQGIKSSYGKVSVSMLYRPNVYTRKLKIAQEFICSFRIFPNISTKATPQIVGFS